MSAADQDTGAGNTAASGTGPAAEDTTAVVPPADAPATHGGAAPPPADPPVAEPAPDPAPAAPAPAPAQPQAQPDPAQPAPAAAQPAPAAAPESGPTPIGRPIQQAPIGGSTAGAGQKTIGGRTGEGARIVGDRVSQAATATAQALRETDVQEIADSTTRLIETARPFFLAAFALLFTFLAWVIDDTAVGVVFAAGAILTVLGAAFSFEVERGLRGRGDDRRH